MIDAHHHLWDPAVRDYPWLAGEALAPIRRAYTLQELRRETGGGARTVLVQTVSSLEETREFLRVAAASDGLIAGVVGWVDLTAPDVVDQLAALREGPGGQRLVGVRHQVQDEPDPQWLARPEVRLGLRAVADAGLAYDLLVLTPQLPVARRLVEELPELRWVLDHAAKPPIADGVVQPWADKLCRLAALPQVSCKLSGLVTEARWHDWSAAGIAPYADVVFDAFGPDRVMYGSDWPVCELAASYADVLDLARQLTSGLSEAETTAVFGSTAERVYRL
ncbi:MAG: amidohydrolase family protein [Micromonosporaceae bacterium]